MKNNDGSSLNRRYFLIEKYLQNISEVRKQDHDRKIYLRLFQLIVILIRNSLAPFCSAVLTLDLDSKM